MPEVREIRVHGVSGTSPEQLLDLELPADVTRVAGDSTTGFWQRTQEGEAKLPDWMRPHRVGGGQWQVEAYSWGALTSGARGALSRAAWLLLTPFALANIASWSRPSLSLPSAAAAESFRPNASAAFVMRLAALTLTLLLVTSAAMVSIDLVAFQCFRGGDLLCPSLPSQAHFLADPAWEMPGRRVAVGAAGPLLVLAGLWWLGRATAQRYEDVPDQSEGTDLGQDEGAVKTYPHLLETTAMWNGRGRWRWLSSVHLIGGLGATLVLTGYTIMQIGGRWDGPARVGVVAGSVLVVVAIVGASAASDGPETEGPRQRKIVSPPNDDAAEAARWVAIGAAGATIGYLVWVASSAQGGRDFIDLDIFPVAMTALATLTGVGVVLGLVAWRCPPSRTWPLRTAVVVVLLGTSTAGVLLVGQGVDAWWLLVLAGVVVALLLHRFGGDSDLRRWWGFRGAAPGVFLGGGLFVALLFTTSTVAGVVVWLAGPSHLARMPTTYAAPPLCAAHGSEADSLDCSTITATGNVELVDGEINIGTSPEIATGRLSVEELAVQLPDGRAVSVPSLTVGAQSTDADTDDVTVVIQSDDQLRVTSTTPGSHDTATYPIPTNADGTRAITVKPRVAIEVRNPPYTGELVIPDAIRSFAAVFPYVVVGALGIGVLSYARTRRMKSAIATRVDADIKRAATTAPAATLPHALSEKISADAARYQDLRDGDPDKRDRLERDMRRLRRTMAFARRGETLLSRVAFLAGTSMMLALVNATGVLLTPPADSGPAPTGLLADLAQLSVTAGLYLCAAAAIGLLALGSQVHRESSFRRPVGILWDLMCFWPRVSHPFSPPCYAERAVPDLYERLDFATKGTNRALLSGHSLGSFLSVAAIFRLPCVYEQETTTGAEPRKNVALLTYGSQLRYYWGRVFPGAFGPQVLGNGPAAPLPGHTPGRPTLSDYEYPSTSSATLQDPGPKTLLYQLDGNSPQRTRWHNLYRLTDPLGFTVLGDDTGNAEDAATRNWLDRPVSEIALPEEGDPTPPALLGHSGYPQSSDYHQWASALANDLSGPNEPTAALTG